MPPLASGGLLEIIDQRLHVMKNVGIDPLKKILVDVVVFRKRFYSISRVDISFIDSIDLCNFAVDAKLPNHVFQIVHNLYPVSVFLIVIFRNQRFFL